MTLGFTPLCFLTMRSSRGFMNDCKWPRMCDLRGPDTLDQLLGARCASPTWPGGAGCRQSSGPPVTPLYLTLHAPHPERCQERRPRLEHSAGFLVTLAQCGGSALIPLVASGPLAFVVQEHMAGSSSPETLSPCQTMHSVHHPVR